MCKASLVWFEVSVDDAIVVEILQCQHRLCKIHPGHIHRQRTHVLQKSGTVSTFRDKCSENTKEMLFKVLSAAVLKLH